MPFYCNSKDAFAKSFFLPLLSLPTKIMTHLLQCKSYAFVSILWHCMTVSCMANIVFRLILHMNDGPVYIEILFEYLSIILTIFVSNRMTVASVIVLNSVDIKLNIFLLPSWMLQSRPDCWPTLAWTVPLSLHEHRITHCEHCK